MLVAMQDRTQRSSSRGGKRIWASRTEAGRQVGNPPCGWARATSQTNIWSEQMVKELCTREAYDESPSTAGHKKTFAQLSKHHRNQSRRHWTALLQLTLLLHHLQYQKCMKTRRRNPQRSQRKTQVCRRVSPDTAMTPGASSSSRGDKRTETLEATSVKKTVDNEVINREANSHVCRRACQTKTDGKKQTRRATTCACQWRAWIHICSTQ